MEARLSHIQLGRLLLASGSAAQALDQFDRYLRTTRQGPLVQEALDGKARALGRLGRDGEARAARRELQRRFPDSLYLEPDRE
jgi:predicted Zn-dependent protease